jgi:hypothetical protein
VNLSNFVIYSDIDTERNDNMHCHLPGKRNFQRFTSNKVHVISYTLVACQIINLNKNFNQLR